MFTTVHKQLLGWHSAGERREGDLLVDGQLVDLDLYPIQLVIVDEVVLVIEEIRKSGSEACAVRLCGNNEPGETSAIA